ncbi:endonuclease/exonuclease/phosphatase family protein [Streptococcus iniae]
MLNKKFFTYASLLALVAVSPVIEESFDQHNSVYAEEIIGPKTEPIENVPKETLESSTSLVTKEIENPLTESPLEVREATESLVASPEVLADANGSKPIAEVKTSPQNQTYTVTGKIISAVDGWGGNGFYMQDSNGSGIYVYPGQALGYVSGDIIQITGQLTTYNGELQLKSISSHHKIQGQLPTAVAEKSIPQLNDESLSTLVKISEVTVGKITSDKYETSTFDAKDQFGNTIAVRVDNRTGIKTSDLLLKINEGDVINLTAIHSVFNSKFQLKPFNLDHFEIVKKAVRKEEASPAAVSQVLKIGQIQGTSHQSPYEKKNVTVKQVVVTYIDDSTHFYVQDIQGDGNIATSDGIRIFTQNLKPQVKVGDVLTISGLVEEYFGRGYQDLKKTDLTMTQIKAKSILKTGETSVPAPLVLGKDRKAPVDIIDNDGLKQFDPQEDAIDYWESMEGMLVAVDNAKIVGPSKNSEIYVLPGDTTRTLNNLGGVSLRPTAYNTDLIPILFKKGKQIIKAGDFYTGRLTGPVSYSYGNYKVVVDGIKGMPTLNDGQLKPEKTHLPKDPSKLSIASYNIENFSANPKSTKNEKVNRIAESFINDLNSPDIIGLIEVQDNNGPTNDGTTDASQSAQRLIDAIKALGGPIYRYVDIAPENNADGGEPGGNIRTGFLYQPDRVSLSEKAKGGANDAVSWENGGLNFSVGRIDPTNAIWKDVRKSLAAEFIFQGNKVVVVANHLNSKRGDNALYGRIQPVAFKSEERRHELAKVLAQFAKEGSRQQANIVMLGDYNDFEFTKTIQLIEEGDMANLVSRHDWSDRYSYFYQGNNQSLDNMLVSTNLLGRYAFDMVHVNSPFMEAHGRASDHDPLLLQLAFPKMDELPSPNKVVPGNKNSENQVIKPKVALATAVKKEGKVLPHAGETSGLMLSFLGMTSLFGFISLKRKGQKN